MNKLIALLVLLGSVVVGNSQLIYGTRGGAGGGGSSAAAIPATIYYVATNGNNATAVAGDATKPYQTAAAVFTAVGNNSVIYFMPGVYNVTPYALYDADNDTLAGAATANLITKTNVIVRGPGANIYGAGQGSLSFIKNCKDITFDGMNYLGDWATTNNVAPATNYAHAFLIGGNENIRFQDCTFDSFGMFGIGSLPNVATAANDNILSLIVDRCTFRNGGATNCAGYNYQGGGIYAKAYKAFVNNNSYDNVTSGLTYNQQYKRGSATVEETILTSADNKYNNVKDSLVYVPTVVSSGGFTNKCIVNISGEVGNNVCQNYPNTAGSAVPVAYNINGATTFTAVGNTLLGGWSGNGGGIISTPNTLKMTGSIVGNTLKGFAAGIYLNRATVNNSITISGNILEGIDGYGVYATGKNIFINNNRFLSVMTNTSTYAGLGQIVATGSFVSPSTNIVVSGNSFDDIPGDNPGISTVFQSDTNCYDVSFIDNMLNARYSAITNDLIMLRSSGVLKQKYTARTTTGTAYPIQFFHLPERTIAGIDYQIRAQSTSITGTNVGCYYIQRNAMKGAAGGSWGLGGGVTADLTLEDGPLSTASVTSGVSGSSASQFYVSVTGTNSTTIDWVLDMTARLLR